MRRLYGLIASLFVLSVPFRAYSADANRLTYIDTLDPYYVSRTFPKLVTPQWVGEDGVEAVVILAIDDMRGHEQWEKFLRPILNRLKRIDGRAPVSIMTCQINPADPHLQTWLKEGLSLETHTIDHPCPLLAKLDFAKARSTYERCVDLMNAVPGNKPVAFRMPCCDSLNTQSPRFFAEMFNQTTAKGNFLTLDSSVFNILTSNDPALPRDLVTDPDGQDRFRKYVPYDRSFVNTIEDYPYPYVIGRLCWEFPCVTPSDWEAQFYHKPVNPITLHDLEAALDAIVLKQGVFDLVFHPYGWIQNEQVVQLIDYAASRYGKKVKFLTFREAQERINKNLLGGQSLRAADGRDNGVRLLDLNGDGYLDVVIGNEKVRQTRIWSPATKSWTTTDFPTRLVAPEEQGKLQDTGARFGVLQPNGRPSVLIRNETTAGAWQFIDGAWSEAPHLLDGLQLDGQPIFTNRKGRDEGVRLRDLDGDGHCELLVGNPQQQAVFAWSEDKKRWERLPFTLPAGTAIVDALGRDNGLRFVDIDEDGHDDVVFSNAERYSLNLFAGMHQGWSRSVVSGKHRETTGTNDPAGKEAARTAAVGMDSPIPPIAINGENNGMWVHSRHLWWQNENTDWQKDHVARRSFNQFLEHVESLAKSPEASLHSIRVRPGFEAELVASEPLIEDPVAFAWGPDGKLWVVEMRDYPLGLDGKGKPGGRIVYLEDTDGDGKYDKATVFLDGIGFPTGVMPWGKGVLVTSAPEIFYAEDTDGDGKADIRRPLFVGFYEGNQQHRVNGLVWGLDNWVYCANGDSGGQVRSVKTGHVVDIRGRDVRIRPDEGLIDPQSGQSQFGRCRDDWGNWFGCNNSDPMYQFVLADQYLRRNPFIAGPTPRVQVSVTPGASRVYPVSPTLPRFNDPAAANHFTSACSVIVYRDELFGPHFAGNSFVSEPVHNLVHREIMTATGVTFSSRRALDERESEFWASSDNWTRPTTIQTGPDGALWVADMYREVIEHPEWIPKDWQKRLDLRAGHDKGRIYRVYPVGQRPRPIPRLDRLDTAGLVAALDSPNGWQRDMAQQLLIHRHDAAAVPLLETQAAENKRPLCRLHALCTLDGLNALKPSVLLRALGDQNPGVRRHAIRLCEPQLAHAPELGVALVHLVDDTDPHVRMQLACTLGEWPDARSGNALGQLALRDADDPYLSSAVMSSINKKNLDTLLLAVLSGGDTQAPPASLTGNLLRLATTLGTEKTLSTLLDRVARPEQGTFAAWQFAALAGLLDTLDQRNQTLATLRQRDPRMQAVVGRLDKLFTAARTIAADRHADAAERLMAIRLLGRGLSQREEDVTRLADLLVPQTGQEIQLAAVTGLGRLRDAHVPEALLRGWKGYSPSVRAQVLDVLLRREDWLRAILTALDHKQILPFEVDAARRQRLLQHRNEIVRDRAARLFAGAIDTDRQKVVEAYRSVLNLKGDPRHGVQVFSKTCATCHQLGGIGHVVGPDLASLGDKSPETLLIAILDPNRAVEARYINYVAATKNGLTLTGILASETGNSITLVGPDAKQHVLLRTDLEELVSSNKSLMPEGLEKELKPHDLADLIAFIRSGTPAAQRKLLEGNTPHLVRAGADGSLLLQPSACEIYGGTLLLEKQFGNLGFWGSDDDRAVWQVDVPRSGKYAVWLEWACADKYAGNSYVLQAGLEQLSGRVAGTGTWENYRKAKVGEITLSASPQTLVFRPAGKITVYLIDLKSIKLVPMASADPTGFLPGTPKAKASP
jgi:putative membrane-bound dehydrogenase-like protein